MRWLLPLIGLIALAPASACDDPGVDWELPPGECAADELRCYYEGVQERELLLICNDGAVEGAIWIIEEVCDEGEICMDDSLCAPPP